MINPGQPIPQTPATNPPKINQKGKKKASGTPFSYPTYPFTCNFPFRQPAPKSLDKVNNQWMATLTAQNPHLKLRDAVIPATHDSGTFSINSLLPFSGDAITQTRSFQGQMELGARLLDLRYGFEGSSNKVRIYHGPEPGEDFIEGLQQIRQFLDQNPNEFAVISVMNEFPSHCPSENQIRFLRNKIFLIFEDIAINGEDVASWFDLDTVTLNQLINGSKKRILILGGYSVSHHAKKPTNTPNVYKREGFGLKHGKVAKNSIIFYRNLNWSSYWVDTEDADVQLAGVVRNVLEEKDKRGILVVSQFNLTPQAHNFEDIFQLVFGCKNYRIDRTLRQMLDKKKLLYFLREKADLPFNYMWFDFPSFIGQAWEFLIGLNYQNKPLNILRAFLDGVDVTEKAKGLVRRGCCLYVVDFVEDFGLRSYRFEGSFQLWYEFGGEGVRRAEYGVVGDDWVGSQFVLSYPISLMEGRGGGVENQVEIVEVSPQ